MLGVAAPDASMASVGMNAAFGPGISESPVTPARFTVVAVRRRPTPCTEVPRGGGAMSQPARCHSASGSQLQPVVLSPDAIEVPVP